MDQYFKQIDEEALQLLLMKLKDKSNLRYGQGAQVQDIDAFYLNMSEGIYNIVPDEFLSVIENINGIIGDDGTLFGVNPNIGYGFEDIIVANKRINRPDSVSIVVLGYNDLDWLTYNNTTQEYQTLP